MATAKTEIWRAVAGYEGLYEVSNLARVKSIERHVRRNGGKSRQRVAERILKPRKSTAGYWQVCLCRDGKRKWVLLHRLVAEAFCKQPAGCDVVNHRDNNIDHNWDTNLEWTTHTGNARHAIAQNRRKARPVIRSDGKFYPIMRMAEADGFRSDCIYRCCNGKAKTHGGYGWSYADIGTGDRRTWPLFMFIKPQVLPIASRTAGARALNQLRSLNT